MFCYSNMIESQEASFFHFALSKKSATFARDHTDYVEEKKAPLSREISHFPNSIPGSSSTSTSATYSACECSSRQLKNLSKCTVCIVFPGGVKVENFIYIYNSLSIFALKLGLAEWSMH